MAQIRGECLYFHLIHFTGIFNIHDQFRYTPKFGVPLNIIKKRGDDR